MNKNEVFASFVCPCMRTYLTLTMNLGLSIPRYWTQSQSMGLSRDGMLFS